MMATVTTKTITKINLDLSLEEAQTLVDMLSKVHGNILTTRRRHAQIIMNELTNVDGVDLRESIRDMSGTLEFYMEKEPVEIVDPPEE
jgi:hypothetical protein